MSSVRRPRSDKWGSTTPTTTATTATMTAMTMSSTSLLASADLVPDEAVPMTDLHRGTSAPSSSLPSRYGGNEDHRSGSPTRPSSSRKKKSTSSVDTNNVTRARDRLRGRTTPNGKMPSSNSIADDASTNNDSSNLSDHFRNVPTGGAGSGSHHSRTSRSVSRRIRTGASTSRVGGNTTSYSNKGGRERDDDHPDHQSLASLDQSESPSQATTTDRPRSMRGTKTGIRRSNNASTSSMDDASVVSKGTTYSEGRSGNTSVRRSRTNAAPSSRGRKNDGQSRSRSRSCSQSRSQSQGRSRSQSRSRSKSRHRSSSRKRSVSAKRRNHHRKSSAAVSAANSNAGEKDPTAVSSSSSSMKRENRERQHDASSQQRQPRSHDASIISIKSKMQRRKPSASSSLSAALANLDTADPTSTGRASRDARSIGPGMPPTRSVMRSKTTTLLPTVRGDGNARRSDPSPQRGVVRSKSSIDDELGGSSFGGGGGLASFLQDAAKKKVRSTSTSRSVSTMPIPMKAPSSGNKKTAHRGETYSLVSSSRSACGDDELELEDIKPRSSSRFHAHHGSYGSGLDFATVNASGGSAPTASQAKQRMSSSYGSGLDFLTASKVEDDAMETKARSNSKKRGRRKKKPGSASDESIGGEGKERSLHISDLLGETFGLEDGSEHNQGSAQSFRRLGKSVLSLGSLATQRRELEFELLRKGITEAEAFKGDNEEDIFTFYAWSSSRQARPKIQRERKLLRDSVRQGAVEATKDGFVAMK